MATQRGLGSRCRQVVDELNQRERWGLTHAQIDDYVAQILRQVPTASLEAQLERIVHYFHAHHRLFLALRDEQSREHEDAWGWVKREIGSVVQRKGLEWSRDRAVELDDLVQTVQAELVRALVDYRFESSLRTWLQSVAVRRLHRFHRDTTAAKRGSGSEPLDAAEAQAIEWPSFEQHVLASALLADINRVLQEAGDARYAQIFRLRVIDDHTAEEIGKRVQLHPSRVRVLLRVARELLQRDARVQAWHQQASGSEVGGHPDRSA